MDSQHNPRINRHVVSEQRGDGAAQHRYIPYRLQESKNIDCQSTQHSSAQNHPLQHQSTQNQRISHEASLHKFDSFLSAYQLETTDASEEPERQGATDQQVKGLTERLWGWMWGKAEKEAATKIEDGEKKVEVPSLMLNGEPLELEW
jgi:hypothetical protein